MKPSRPQRVPVARFQRRNSAQRGLLALGAVGVLAALSWADHRGLLLYGGDRSAYHARSFRVTRILDGNTIEIDHPDGGHATTRVRLLGINAPPPDAPEVGGASMADQAYTDPAAALVRKCCEGKTVTLELAEHPTRDKYHRLLAYVTLADGTVLNERVLAAGLARAGKRFPHAQAERYDLLERQARFDRIGLWAAGWFGPATRPTQTAEDAAEKDG